MTNFTKININGLTMVRAYRSSVALDILWGKAILSTNVEEFQASIGGKCKQSCNKNITDCENTTCGIKADFNLFVLSNLNKGYTIEEICKMSYWHSIYDNGATEFVPVIGTDLFPLPSEYNSYIHVSGIYKGYKARLS